MKTKKYVFLFVIVITFAIGSFNNLAIAVHCPSGCGSDTRCDGRYETMVVLGENYCCATWHFWRGRTCGKSSSIE